MKYHYKIQNKTQQQKKNDDKKSLVNAEKE